MIYMLDTNIVSDIIRNPRGKAAVRAEQIDEKDIFLSIIVVAELRFGVTKRPSPIFSQRLEALFEKFAILPFDEPVDRFYAELRQHLESTGKPISANDMLIAAHALALGHTFVTDNVREFSRIKGLSVENWLR
jgi:tRNA(fMet)-specific endonuclease VapC